MLKRDKSMKIRLFLFVGVLVVMILVAGLLFSNKDSSVTVSNSNNVSYLIDK